MLLPISHEKMTVRRLPLVTMGLIVMNVVAFLAQSLGPGEEKVAMWFGYVPDRGGLLGLFTYMFVHVSVWHLAGNVWFLFLCGMALEDRWGRLAFGAFYVVAGVVAAGIHHVATTDGSVPLVGASGAVAGAMGAFLVLFATTKIRILSFFSVRPKEFAAPAYVMLPLWAVVELVYGLLIGPTGSAHWAHVGGFGFGVVVAGGFRLAGLDRRLDDAAERAAVLGGDPRIDTARAMIAKGAAFEAVALLEGLAIEKPKSSHVREALREARSAAGGEAVGAERVERSGTGSASVAVVTVGSVEVAPYFPTGAGAETGTKE